MRRDGGQQEQQQLHGLAPHVRFGNLRFGLVHGVGKRHQFGHSGVELKPRQIFGNLFDRVVRGAAQVLLGLGGRLNWLGCRNTSFGDERPNTV